MEPDEIEQLLGAYALDAVDDDERRVIERYLSTNPRARAEVQQHREVATLLAFTGAPAPDGLWDRIAASLDDRAPAPGPELAKVLTVTPRRRARAGWLAAGVAAAAAAVIIGVLSVAYVQRGHDLDRARQQAAAGVDLQLMMMQALTDPRADVVDLRSPDGTLTARAVIEPSGVGYLAATGLPALTGADYQLWGVLGDKVISLGVLGARPEVVTFTVDGDLKALAITKEQPGGVPVSEQPAALAGELS